MKINYHHFDQIDSTQNRARELIAAYELPFIVTANSQTAGRGRQGRTWVSSPGNFFGSLALRGAVRPDRYHEYSFIAALAVRDTVAEFTQEKFTLKWPNDVLLNGKKCAGILIESDGMQNEFLIIGIGVNLIHQPDVDYPVAALWPGTADDAARRARFTQALVQNFADWHDRYINEGFEIIRAEWLLHAHALGQEITVKTPAAEMVGVFSGLDKQGSLLLTQGDRTIKVTTADVRI